MERPLVILGAVEAIVRQALVSAAGEQLEIRESQARSTYLSDEVLAAGAQALVAGIDDAREQFELLPPDVLVVGLSSTRSEALVRKRGEAALVPNPTPDEIVALCARPIAP